LIIAINNKTIEAIIINVIIKFDDEEVKQRIIEYCKENNLEYTVCPRYIRVNENAVSIELKRL